MSEFMRLVQGRYDAKPEGFEPGGASLHNSMVPHGRRRRRVRESQPRRARAAQARRHAGLHVRSRWRFVPTAFAMTGSSALDAGYAKCWSALEHRFGRA
jgi:homogentisate 1,2-dioxygenase